MNNNEMKEQGYVYRHELKFFVPERELCLIENKIAQLCRRDIHTGERGIYNIRSIYFDTFDDRYLKETENGVDNRKKYRIRIYNKNADIIKLECKRTERGMKAKEFCDITREQCIQLMQGNIMIPCEREQKVLQQLQYEHMRYLLEPKVIVEYMRTPFVYDVGNVRITFDRNIASSHYIKHFFDDTLQKRMVTTEGYNILEVKYDEMLPYTILELLRECAPLRRVSFSKYVMSRKNSLR